MDLQPIINELCANSLRGTCIVHVNAIWALLGIVTSILAAIVVAIWFVLRWAYSTVIEHKDAEINSLKTQLNSYQDKLDGATPDQAQARIAALERAVRGLKPRSMTNEQITTIRSRLQQTLPRIEIAVTLARDSSASDGQLYMTQIKEILGSVERVHTYGIEVAMDDKTPAPSGLAIQINSQYMDGSRKIAEIIGAAFAAAEVPFDYGYFDGKQGAHVRIYLFPNQHQGEQPRSHVE